MLKDVHFLQVTESANHHQLVQLQLHDEQLKPDSTTRGGYTHGNHPALAVSSLSDHIKEKIKNIIADSDSVGIQMDESTDITKKQVLIILANVVKNGNATMVFLKAMEIASATSDFLFQALRQVALEEYGINKQQLCCINTDGASALSGVHGGLQTLARAK